MSVLARLIAAGVDAELIEEVALLMAEKKAAEKALAAKKELARERQARKRDRDSMSRDVTQRNVTERDMRDPSLSLPPNENNSNPPTHTHPDNKPARKGKSQTPAKPDGVKDQTWADFVDLRRRKRAPITPTAMAGINREVAKAGWALEDALAETVTRGWQSFKAEFVTDKRPPPPKHGDQSSYLDHYFSKQSAGAS